MAAVRHNLAVPLISLDGSIKTLRHKVPVASVEGFPTEQQLFDAIPTAEELAATSESRLMSSLCAMMISDTWASRSRAGRRREAELVDAAEAELLRLGRRLSGRAIPSAHTRRPADVAATVSAAVQPLVERSGGVSGLILPSISSSNRPGGFLCATKRVAAGV